MNANDASGESRDTDIETYRVLLVSKDRTPQLAAVRVYGDSEDCRIELSFDRHLIQGVGEDFFESFCRVREKLEELDLLPRCYAAHLHAFPSGMSRSMGGGTRLYRLTLARQANREDLIHMFECDDKVIPSTVADQQAFYKQWCASLT